MPSSKFKWQSKIHPRRLPFPLPKILDKLPISESAIQRIKSANDTHLLRFYFGTANQSDSDALFTHLVISWGLAGRMQDAEKLRQELWKGIGLIKQALPSAKGAAVDPMVPVVLQDIVQSSLALWRLTTVEELNQTIDEVSAEFVALQNRRKH